ncbi:hypothetical protein DMA11_17890 [Marinilabiliaceae bacterium JC017]|nr:hypothetical protein DMA11_17890 [Marinilabiliaceae bacterium JC017]
MKRLSFTLTICFATAFLSIFQTHHAAGQTYSRPNGRQFELTETQKSTTTDNRRIEITPFSGYQLNGKIKFLEGSFKMDNAINYGTMISVEVHPGTLAEFVYSRTDTEGEFHRYLNGENKDYNLSLDYFQLAVVKELKNGPVIPFGTFSAGATWFNMKDSGIDDDVRMSIGLGGGLKVFLSDRIGLRLQGRLLLPLYFEGGGIFLGVGSGGSGGGVSLGSTALVVQGDFTGGLIIRLGN